MDQVTTGHPKYGFFGRLKKEFPSQIIVDITEKCNLACIHCQHPQFVKSPHYHGLDMEGEINTKLVQEVRKEGKDITEYLRYTSDGEPLLHPKGYQFIQEAVHDSGVPVTLTTNGTRIDHEKIKSLIDEGLFLIDISIDAYSPETYQQIRVGGHLEKTKKNIERMISYRNKTGSKTRIVVSFIEQPANAHEISLFRTYWEEHGADFVVIRRLHSNAGTIESLAKGLRTLTNSQERKPCVYPWERICLKPDGTLHYCPASWTKEAFIGDFYTSTIKEIWTGKRYRALRDSHLANDFFEFPMCNRCPDWIQIRWPDEGRSYANMIEDFSAKDEGKHGSE
jgi:radical SAM protein with 4Fe4S-binding SPASM domain